MIPSPPDPRGARWAFLWAVLLAVLILCAVYPGFMSYDSLHALREARGAVRGGPYPTIVSYLWRPLDRLFPGPAAMLLVQDAVLLAAIAGFLVWSGLGTGKAMAGLALVAIAPPVLGPMLVVWKDVAMSASFAAAALVLYLLDTGRLQRRAWLAAAVLLVFVGMAYRLNALPATIPLLVWAALIHARRGDRGGKAALLRGAALGVVLAGVLYAGVTVLNSFRLPDFSRLDPNPSLRAFQIYDLIGIAARTGDARFAARAGLDEAEVLNEARRGYDPRHLNLAVAAAPDGLIAGYVASAPAPQVASAWRDAVLAHPGVYLAHRWETFRELVGLTSREVFYPTHGRVDPNEFGYEHRPNAVSRFLVTYLNDACDASPVRSLGCRTWLYHLAGLAALLACIAWGSRPRRAAALAVFGSGLGYLLPQFLISHAADLRYTQWSVIASILTCVLAIGTLLQMYRSRREPVSPLRRVVRNPHGA